MRAGALAWARASGSAGRFGPSGAGQAEERLGLAALGRAKDGPLGAAGLRKRKAGLGFSFF